MSNDYGNEDDCIYCQSEDSSLDPYEIAYRRNLFNKAFAGDKKAQRTLRNTYGLTYIKRGDIEVYLMEESIC